MNQCLILSLILLFYMLVTWNTHLILTRDRNGRARGKNGLAPTTGVKMTFYPPQSRVTSTSTLPLPLIHDDVIKWKHFPRYWPFVRGIHRSPVNSPHKGQWRGALMFSLICVWINSWVINGKAGDLRRYRVHYDVTVMITQEVPHLPWLNVTKYFT